MKYYKHVDGLRALAVLSVVLFHLNISWIKSGFLGVDIFFVISGFLITTIILRDLNNNCFSIKNFYLRRMRRILPALITVLVFSTFFAWLILLPQDLKNYSKSLVSAIASVSNLFFYKFLSFGYFSTDATVIPLLHTWSLGVEEQFYIFWPLFLISIYYIGILLNIFIVHKCKNWDRIVEIKWKKKSIIKLDKSSINISKVLIPTILITIASIYIFRFNNNFSAEKYYYFPMTRGFELLFGCLLAIYLSNNRTTNNKRLLDIISLVGIILILFPILFINVGYPSNWMIVACLGATLYIYSGTNQDYIPLINRIFSLKPFIAIGLISYSLYLWHWPIIAYINYMSIDKTIAIKIAILIVSIILATLTYFFIEKPFRYRFKTTFTKTLVLLWCVPIILACAFALSSKYVNEFGFNKINPIALKQSESFYGILKESDRCMDSGTADSLSNKKLCIIGDTTKKPSFLVVGDSHAMAAVGMLNVWLKNISQSGYVTTMSANPFMVDKNSPFATGTIKRNKAIQGVIQSHNYKYVVMGGAWEQYAPVKSHDKGLYSGIEDGIEGAVSFIIKNGAIPIILLDNPRGLNLKTTCGLTRISVGRCYNPIEENIKDQKVTRSFFKKLKQKYPQLVLIDPSKIICDSSKCYMSIDGTPLYFTSGLYSHLSYPGSKLIGELYLKKYGNPLKPAISS